ncbi:Protein phosphatase 2C family protein [Dioscorea alata]|uniref:Protein phosphatase 2C family protein n=1 Tax=Dioscorea alata TaxID=55571 RepID=A0ACB7UNU9_DIOAL|nr:Protein phosphatase 2C family protein [Dioscorea alata]
MFYMKKPEFWTDSRTNVKILKRRGGSTAVTVILIDGRMLVVENVCDSRAVLSEKCIGRQLSVDHEPLKEHEKIENRGGVVTHERGNVSRVDGQLAMSRTFGDSTLKEHISSDPDVVIETIDDDAEMII